jgi:hypothetical protein
MTNGIPTARSVSFIDADLQPPPSGAQKLILLSRYGVTTIGTFQEDFHVAWAPLPKIPASVKAKMNQKG